jgi:Lon-like protease
MPAPPAPTTSPRRFLLLGVCAVLCAALLALAALAPLPFAVAYPGVTADVLGRYRGDPVIRISGAEVRDPTGELRMTTIAATSADTPVRLLDVVRGYFSSDRAVMPRDAVYPVGDSEQEIRKHNTTQMLRSQDAAVLAALGQLGMAEQDVEIDLELTDVGGPSAGLLFSLGIVDMLDGDGNGGDLTGGRTVAGTGTITADGTVGPVGGVPLKTQAARRDGATVFLVPAGECGAALSDPPDGLRLIPVTTLAGALEDLRALAAGESVPSC